MVSKIYFWGTPFPPYSYWIFFKFFWEFFKSKTSCHFIDIFFFFLPLSLSHSPRSLSPTLSPTLSKYSLRRSWIHIQSPHSTPRFPKIVLVGMVPFKIENKVILFNIVSFLWLTDQFLNSCILFFKCSWPSPKNEGSAGGKVKGWRGLFFFLIGFANGMSLHLSEVVSAQWQRRFPRNIPIAWKIRMWLVTILAWLIKFENREKVLDI